MLAAKQGDKMAFSTLYDLYFVPVYRYIFFRVRTRHEAEDLAQTVFTKAFASLPSFRDMGKAPLAYFFTIARNTVINFWRRKREISLETNKNAVETLVAKAPGPEDDAVRSQAMEKLRGALQKLSEDQQEAITLRFIAELSNAEIARLMGKSEEAIRQLHSRGLKSLRGKLSDV